MGVHEVVAAFPSNSKGGVRKAVIPAAGIGSRFLPLSKSVAKEMVPIVDKPLIQYVIEEAAASGIDEVIVVISRAKRAIVDYFEPSPQLESLLEKKGDFTSLESLRGLRMHVDLRFVYQEQALGLGHAILCAQPEIGDESFAVLLGDNIIDAGTPCIRQLIQVFEQHPGGVVAVGEVAPEHVSRFGMVIGEPMIEAGGDRRLFRINDLVEKPRPGSTTSTIGIYGRYVFPSDIFSYIRTNQAAPDTEIQLTDAIAAYCRDGRPVHGYCFEGRHFDVGDKVGFLEANVAFGLKHPVVAREFRAFLESELAASLQSQASTAVNR